MNVNWRKLEISPTQLEEILDFNLRSILAIEIGRVFFLKQREYKSLLMTQVGSLFLVCLLCFPIVLILFRNSSWLSNNTSGLIFSLAIAIIVSLLCSLIFNYFLWQRAKQLKIFVALLAKVKQYNELIDNLALISELDALSTSQPNQPENIAELKTALDLTRNSLIKSIELEKIINRDRHLANNRYQLLANLESGLINLNALQAENTDVQLFSEAINLGLSVHRELRKNHYCKEIHRQG